MTTTRDQGNWTYAVDDAALPEGSMTPVYPLGVSVLLARVESAS